jgi:transcriptional regulator with XRE-family HTH domain
MAELGREFLDAVTAVCNPFTGIPQIDIILAQLTNSSLSKVREAIQTALDDKSMRAHDLCRQLTRILRTCDANLGESTLTSSSKIRGDATMRKFSYTVGSLIKNYRELARLSQKELAELSDELARQGVFHNGIHRQNLSRIETDQVTEPQEETLHKLALTLAHALKRAGYSAMKGEEIYHHLRLAAKDKVFAKQVSREAAALDATLGNLAPPLRAVIWSWFLLMAHTLINGMRGLDAPQ